MRFMVSSDMEDNLMFMARQQLGQTTGSHFAQGVIVLPEVVESSVRNVGDLADSR